MEEMGDLIVIAVLAALVVLCLKSSIRHWKGDGCCGGAGCSHCACNTEKQSPADSSRTAVSGKCMAASFPHTKKESDKTCH